MTRWHLKNWISFRHKRESRLAATERLLQELTEEVARNEDKMRRTQRRELCLLQADDLVSLFNALIGGLKDSYGLAYVSVVLCDSSHEIRELLLASGTPAEKFSRLVMVDSLQGQAPQYENMLKPWLGRFASCHHQKICPDAIGNAVNIVGTQCLQSIAMIPLTQRGKLVGSINLCSNDEHRFTGAHASDFLARLGVIASFCIENAVNRAHLLRSGFTDVLTGWHNRRYLSVRLPEVIARARRDNTRVTCLMLDIDHFKRVNDTWGHDAGDTVLREIAHRIDTQVRISDVAARFGGEEFVVLLPNTDVSSATGLAERIRQVISRSSFELPSGDSVFISVSIGIARICPSQEDDDLKAMGESLIARADVALYDAKSAGRDRVVVEAA